MSSSPVSTRPAAGRLQAPSVRAAVILDPARRIDGLVIPEVA